MSRYERKIIKIGNSYGITLPNELLKKSGINYGDSVEISASKSEISIQKKEITLSNAISPDFSDLLERNADKYQETIRDLVDR